MRRLVIAIDFFPMGFFSAFRQKCWNSYPSFTTILRSFYILVTVHLGTIPINNQFDAEFPLYIYLSRFSTCFEQPCAHHQESQLYKYNIWYVTLCRWPSGMQVGRFLPDLHTRRSPTQSNIHQMLYWYNWLSWWAQGCSKHVENRDKYI